MAAIRHGKVQLPATGTAPAKKAPARGVVSIKGGKVHAPTPGTAGDPFPFCRTGGADSAGTFYVETTYPVSCQGCAVATGQA